MILKSMLAVLVITSAVTAQQVSCSNQSGPLVIVRITTLSGTQPDICFAPGATISLTNVNNTWTRINVFSRNSSTFGLADIGRIDLSGTNTPPGRLDVIIGATSSVTGFSSLVPAGVNWAGMTVSGTGGAADLINRVVLSGQLSGNLTGGVSTGRVAFLAINGEIRSAIETTSSAIPAAAIRASSVTSAGSITAQQGNIQSVEIFGSCLGAIRAGATAGAGSIFLMSISGDLLSNVEVGAELRSLTVTGRVGSRSSPVMLGVGTKIRSLVAGELNATVRGFQGAPQTAEIFQLRTTGGAGTDGGFRGSLASQRLVWESPVLGFLRFTGPVEGPIRIGEDLLAGQQSIEVPAGGLRSQIILGQDTIAPRTWSGSVIVGSTTLAPVPTYANLSAALGGGAVGLVPFALHDEDCSPVAGASLAFDAAPRGATSGGGAAVPIRLRHYGPVTWEATNGSPYIIERRKLGSAAETPWLNESACFTQTRDPLNPTIIILTPARDEVLHPGFEYRARLAQFGDPASNVLRCDLPSGNKPPVADQTPA